MLPIIAREREVGALENAFSSQMPEFVTVFGRRRVGKTYLVRNTFLGKKNTAFFYVTGKKRGKIADQIKHFVNEIGPAFFGRQMNFAVPTSWDDAFRLLTEQIEASSHKKIVLFFDEFPWMVTRKSGLLQVLDDYWNHRWSRDPRIKLIVCGSSACWILKHIINDKGGFYNRVTSQIRLQPFTLCQAKMYLKFLKIKLSNKQIGHLYMVLGGIPHYLNQVKPGLSAMQAVEELAFGKRSFLMTEFENLYSILFSSGNGHIELARIIASHPYGIGQEALSDEAEGISSGSGLLSRLKDLTEAGFIERFKPYEHKKKGIFYKMVDEYSIFYFRWIEPIKNTLIAAGMRKGHWEQVQHTPAWHTWAGYAFESMCYKHIPQISQALGLNPTALPYTWRFVPTKGAKERGAQIDLFFDRNDDSITLCEIKYTDAPFAVDKDYAYVLARKARVFKEKTRTPKAIFWALVSASGVKKTLYSEEMISGVASLDDLFNPVL